MRAYLIFLVAQFLFATHLGAQECRAVSDCASGRCVSTIVCDRSNENGNSRPIPAFAPARLPDPIAVSIGVSTPDSVGRVAVTGSIKGAARPVEILLNGAAIEVKPNSEGIFRVDRGTVFGSNEFQVSVVDEYGRTSTARTMIYRSNPAALAQTPQKRVALIIGNSNYQLGKLTNPLNDANDFSLMLKEAGFEVQDIRDASLSTMRQAMRVFGDNLKAADEGIFYFAGHGLEVKGRNYLIPIGADIRREDEIPDQSLDVGAVLEKVESAKKPAVVVLDACRNNPFARSFRTSSSGLAQMDTPTGTLVAFATSPGKIAADGLGRNSPFTKYLIQSLRERGIPIEQALKNVRRRVLEETKGLQTPWENSSLTIDFVIFRQ